MQPFNMRVNYEVVLNLFFEDGRLELTNNRAERNIKELVIGRKIGCIPQVLKEHELQESF